MPEIKSQITTGNLIQIGLTLGPMLIAGIVAFALVRADMQALAKSNSDHEIRIRTLERDVIGGLAKIDTRLGRIEEDMRGGK